MVSLHKKWKSLNVIILWQGIFNHIKQMITITNCLSLVQAALVICGLFICDFTYMRSRNGLFSGTYPLIYSNPWSFYMQICYMKAYFWSPYLSHITRSTCTLERTHTHTQTHLNTLKHIETHWNTLKHIETHTNTKFKFESIFSQDLSNSLSKGLS